MTEILGTAALDDYYRSAFWRGAAATFDRRGNTRRLYVYSATSHEANLEARLNDLVVIEEDATEVLLAIAND